MSGFGDGTGWSSERGSTPGYGGSNGNAGNGVIGGTGGGDRITILKRGDSYMTPWGKVSITKDGYAEMNGMRMTADNSSMVEVPGSNKLSYVRVITEHAIARPPVAVPGAGTKTVAQTVVENYLAGGNWANKGLMDEALVNTAISDTLKNEPRYDVPKPKVPSTQIRSWRQLRASFDDLAFSEQPAARAQIVQAWINASNAQPEKVTEARQAGGRNGNISYVTIPNPVRNRLDRVRGQITADLNAAVSQNQAAQTNEALTGAAGLITDVGEKVGVYAGAKYRQIAAGIAGNVRNFQGRSIRGFDQAMGALNQLRANPAMRFSAADTQVLANAWQHVNATDMARKMGNIAKAFKVGDIALKVQKVGEKSLEGYRTGNWGPLMLEVESWVLAGMAGAVALSLLTAIISTFTLSLPVTATVLTVAGLMLIAYLSSLIDDKATAAFNSYLISLAH